MRGLETYGMGYVDDHGMLVISPVFESTCPVLVELHRLVMDWAWPRRVAFSPDKYAVIHFRPPRHGRVGDGVIPPIYGMSKEALGRSVGYLGVVVDESLQWQEHIAQASQRPPCPSVNFVR